jgi:N-methylhydantoinase A/oxoprolinase/acetone carboxylase beta subunit
VLNRDGATVGGWRTMVEAIAVHTFGLGGDSEVRIDPERGLLVGPRRIVPLSLLAHRFPPALAILREQAQQDAVGPLHGCFAVRAHGIEGGEASLSAAERRVWDGLGEEPVPLTIVLGSLLSDRPLRRLVERGLVRLAGFTPSDAAHVLGRQSDWSGEAARIGAELYRRRPAEPGWRGGMTVEDFAEAVIERVCAQSCEALIASAIESSGGPAYTRAEPLGALLVDRAAAGREAADSLYAVAFRLTRPLVAIGAPVATYYPEVARRLGTRLVVPPHHGVTNAVGAVAGGIFETAAVTITAPREDRFRLHGIKGVRDFAKLEEAAAAGIAEARGAAHARAVAAGAATVEIAVERKDTVVSNFGADLFIESAITATATGRPRLG